MQATMKDGKFVSADGNIPENQDVVVTLLNRCLRWAELVLERSVITNHTSQTLLTGSSGKERSTNDLVSFMTN